MLTAISTKRKGVMSDAMVSGVKSVTDHRFALIEEGYLVLIDRSWKSRPQWTRTWSCGGEVPLGDPPVTRRVVGQRYASQHLRAPFIAYAAYVHTSPPPSD